MLKTPKPKKKLTPKQTLFIQEYLIDLNATQSAIRAGYSQKTAEVAGSRLLGNVKIKTILKKEQDKRAKKLEITADTIIKDIRDIGDDALKAKKHGDALKSRELLGKHLKLFTDKIELGFDDSAFKAILAVLPPEYAEQVRQALIAGVKK